MIFCEMQNQPSWRQDLLLSSSAPLHPLEYEWLSDNCHETPWGTDGGNLR